MSVTSHVNDQNIAAGAIPVYMGRSGDVPDTVTNAAAVAGGLLGAGGVFTGPWVAVLNYAQIAVTVYSDAPSATGGLSIQFSADGVNLDHFHNYSIPSSTTPAGSTGSHQQVHVHEQYYRIVYTNGATPQTIFRLDVLLRPIAAQGTVVEADDTITGNDDALLTKSIGTAKSPLSGGNYVDIIATPDGALMMNQNTTVDALNSSTANLAVGATFTGTWVSDITYTSAQFTFKADQNFIIYIEQSEDGIVTDISDSYEYFHAIPTGGFGISVQLTSTFYRVRATNIGTATTTVMRLQTIGVPFLSPLPRSLSRDGYLLTAVNHIEDDSGFTRYYTPFGEGVSVPLYRLAGAAFNNSTLDSNFWSTALVGSGTAAVTDANLSLQTGATANSSSIVQSVTIARLVAGAPNKYRSAIQLPDTGTLNNVRNWGVIDSTRLNGAYFQISGTTFNLVTRKNGVETAIANGTFNGVEGNVFQFDTNGHVYEIIIDPGVVFFYIDTELIHRAQFTVSTWSQTKNFSVYFENTNSGGSTTNVIMNSRGGAIMRFGLPSSQPVSKYIIGNGATNQTLKFQSGNIHGLSISGVTNGAIITLYDSVTASGTVLWASGTMGPQTTPLDINLHGVAFNNGLTLSNTGAAANTFVAYE